MQPGVFLDRLHGPLLKFALPLMENVLISLSKSILIPLGLPTAASASNTAIKRNIPASRTTLIVLNKRNENS